MAVVLMCDMTFATRSTTTLPFKQQRAKGVVVAVAGAQEVDEENEQPFPLYACITSI